MLIKNGNVYLVLRNPQRVTDVLPDAVVHTHGDKHIVIVPHHMGQTRILRNLGFNVPSPILSDYPWPSNPHKVPKPFIHQAETSAHLTLHPRAFVLNGMGSGKTLSVLWAYDYLRSQGHARRMLVVAPLSTLERVWADEIYEHFPHLDFAVLHGSRDKRMALLEESHDIYIINHDGIKNEELCKALAARRDINTVVFDEVASFRNRNTNRWRFAQRIVRGGGKAPKDMVWGLTGTPMPRNAADVYGQVSLINPTRLGDMSPRRFRDTVLQQVTTHKWINRPDALDIAYGVMQPAIRFSTADCIDLPPTTYTTRQVAPSQEQSKAYNEMLRTLYTEVQEGQITAGNEAVKAGKMLQICCGAVYDNEGNTLQLPIPERINTVREVIEQAEAKVIVFVPYSAPLHHVAEQLARDFTVAVVDGSVSKTRRDAIFHQFQNTPEPRVLVANAATMAHGLTLTAANTIVWFAPVYSLEIYEQANARVPRPGQKLHTTIVNIASTPLEQKIYNTLTTRGQVQGLLLSMFCKDTNLLDSKQQGKRHV
ncbi:MAG: DEAD/DEAH box helicase [Comamonadaceae bacterium]|nr:DEAD/DEAH box helicase [Comamonadaceae bacterium]